MAVVDVVAPRCRRGGCQGRRRAVIAGVSAAEVVEQICEMFGATEAMVVGADGRVGTAQQSLWWRACLSESTVSATTRAMFWVMLPAMWWASTWSAMPWVTCWCG